MAQLIKKLYFQTSFTWPKVIVYAVVLGVACGLIMMCHALDNTSIHQFGVSPEAWLFLGLFICTNAKKPTESALKLFVFFLISQPLVYLTMWPEYQRFPWEYYMYWFYWTLACLPMGFLAWYIKKGNALSVVVVILTCMFDLFMAADYAKIALHSFPQDILATLFCLAQVPLYILVFLPEKMHRIIASVVSVVVAVFMAVCIVFAGPNTSLGFGYDNADKCTITIADESIVEITEITDNSIALDAKSYGSTTLSITDPSGTTTEYPVTVDQNGLIEIVGITTAE